MSKYGLPYQGSKNAIAEWIVGLLPGAENFYDLFAGGCAITHRALIEKRWKNYIANDIDDAPVLFLKAIHGELRDEKRWIRREDFARLKDTDSYVSICWSFGNNRTTYLYSKEIEPWKKALHYARVYGDYSLLKAFGIDSNGGRADITKHKEEYKEKYIRWWLEQQEYTKEQLDQLIANCQNDNKKEEAELREYLLTALKKSGLTQAEVNKRLGTQMCGHYFGQSQWAFPTEEEYKKMQAFLPLPIDYNEIVGLYRLRQSLERLEMLESLQRLQRLQSLESLERLEVFRKSYDEIEIKPNSVIYCDIPYENTAVYRAGDFDHKRFYDWAAEQKEPIFISSYNIADERFEEIAAKSKTTLFSGTGAKQCTEKLYTKKGEWVHFPETIFDLL